VLEANGRDDKGWKANVAAWKPHGKPGTAKSISQRVIAGWDESGTSAQNALDNLKLSIRDAVAKLEN
jgi:hypothetical protein